MNPRTQPIFLLLIGIVLAFGNWARADVVYETPSLSSSAAINWDGRSHETIDSRVFADQASIRLVNCSDIVISCCDLHSIELADCRNVTIRNCYIHDSSLVGVQMYKGNHVTVQGCRFETVASGVYAIESEGIQVLGNFGRNMQGPFPRGQLAQFDNVKGAGNVISGNYVINETAKSHPEDDINVYQSTGTKESPILVENNYLAGDPALGSKGMSKTGSGIMLGDCGGGYQICRNNVVFNAGQVGIGVAGGDNLRVENNLIFIARSDVSNVGLYVWNQSKKPSGHAVFSGNRVQCTNKEGEASHWWDGGGVSDVEEKGNQFGDANLAGELPGPPSLAPMPPEPWGEKRADGNVVVKLPWKP